MVGEDSDADAAYDDARRLFENAAALDPEWPEPHVALSSLAFRRSREAETLEEAEARIQEGFDYLDRMDELVPQVVRELGADARPEDIAREALTRLGFDPPPVLPIVVTSIMAHAP